jgi:hypothetical protein
MHYYMCHERNLLQHIFKFIGCLIILKSYLLEILSWSLWKYSKYQAISKSDFLYSSKRWNLAVELIFDENFKIYLLIWKILLSNYLAQTRTVLNPSQCWHSWLYYQKVFQNRSHSTILKLKRIFSMEKVCLN